MIYFMIELFIYLLLTIKLMYKQTGVVLLLISDIIKLLLVVVL